MIGAPRFRHEVQPFIAMAATGILIGIAFRIFSAFRGVKGAFLASPVALLGVAVLWIGIEGAMLRERAWNLENQLEECKKELNAERRKSLERPRANSN